MTARIKPLLIYIVRRDGSALTLHAVQVIRESPLSYYVAAHDQWLFAYRVQIPKTKAHRSMKAAWSAMRDELMGSKLYLKASMANLDTLIAQIPKRIPRTSRKQAA